MNHEWGGEKSKRAKKSQEREEELFLALPLCLWECAASYMHRNFNGVHDNIEGMHDTPLFSWRVQETLWNKQNSWAVHSCGHVQIKRSLHVFLLYRLYLLLWPLHRNKYVE